MASQRKVRGATTPDFSKYWLLYFDLAGFSDMIRDPGRRDEIASQYVQILEMVRNESGPVSSLRLNRPEHPEDRLPPHVVEGTRREWRTRLQILSDSIFFFFDADPQGVQNPWAAPQLLFSTAAEVSLRLWAAGLPHRGAIAFGDCWLDPQASLAVGKVIVQAVDWEKAQDWFGVSVEPSASAMVGGILRGERNVPIKQYIVPTKAGPVPALCVNPVYFARFGFGGRGEDVTETNALLAPALAGLEQLYDDAVSHANLSAIGKYVQTARFLRACGVHRDQLGICE